jgi:hypothetical protein
MPKQPFAKRLDSIVHVLFDGNGRLAARTVGMDATAFHRLATGVTPNPRLTTLRALAHGFGLPIAYLSGEKSSEELQPRESRVAEEFWMLMQFYSSRQESLRNLIASIASEMSVPQRRKNPELIELSEFSLFPLDLSSPIATLAPLLNRENPIKEEIDLVRTLYEAETVILELALKRLKEIGVKGWE